MCFEINYMANRPTQDRVWKVLRKVGEGEYVSPHVSERLGKADSQWGHWRDLVGLPTIAEDIKYRSGQYKELTVNFMPVIESGHSRAGLYVWLTKKAALDDLVAFEERYFLTANLVVVECSVSPIDWICSSCDAGMPNAATYRALTPLQEVA
jgi:hypothetical protein